MEIRLNDSEQPPFPQPPQPVQPRPQVHTPMVYVYDEQKWEYKVLARNVGDKDLLQEQELNELGSKGWELAGVATLPEKIQFYFKRVRR